MGIDPQYIITGLTQRGMPLPAALGFAGNFKVESGFDPGINEINPTVKGSRGGFGLAQWTGPRRRQLEAYAGTQGRDIADPDLQMDFLMWELQNTEKRAGQIILASDNPEDAARLVSTEFLRPGIPHLDARIKATADLAGGATASGTGTVTIPAQGNTVSPAQTVQDRARAALAIINGPRDAAAGAYTVVPTPEAPAPMPLANRAAAALAQYNAMQTPEGRIAAARAGTLQVSPESAAGAAEMDARSLAAMQQPQTVGDSLSRGLGLTARAIGEGVASVPGLLYDPIAVASNTAFGTNIPSLRDQVGSAMTAAGVPVPETGIERIVGAGASALAGGGASVGVARLAGAVPGMVGAVGQGMAAQPLAQLTGAAGSGIGAQGAAEAGAGMVGQIVGGLAGGIAGGAAGMRFEPGTTALEQTVADAKRLGVPVMTTDVAPPTTGIGRITKQVIPESIPIAGTGGPRATQQAARIAAIKDVARQYGADAVDSAPDEIMADLVATRGAFVEKYKGIKNEVIDRLSSAPVPVTKAVAAIDDQIAGLEAQKLASNDAVIAKLLEWRDALMGVEVQKLPSGQSVRVATGQPLRQIEEIRKSIGQAFNDPGLAGVKAVGEKALSAVYGPLRDDMGAYIKTAGEPQDFTQWAVANRELADGMQELGVTAFKRALAMGEVQPETVMRMVTSQTPSSMRLLYDNLSGKGRARVQSAVLGDVIAKSGGMDELSPERFLTEIKKRGNQVGIFFTGEDAKAIKSLQDVLKLTRQAGQANITPPTGARLVPFATASAGFAGANALGASGMEASAIAATILGTVGGIARVYESPAVRNLLLRYGSVEASAKPAIAAQIIRTIGAMDSEKEKTK